MVAPKKLPLPEMLAFIHSLRGKYKPEPCTTLFAERMGDLNFEERELEERRFQRLAALNAN